MSSLFEVPAQLALVLTLAASGPGEVTRAAPPPVDMAAVAPTQVLLDLRHEGPYRFSESSWLRALREDLPAEAALPAYSGRIFKTSSGRYYVPAAAERRPILAARANADLAARAAQAFAAHNASRLRAALRRPATAGDLYIAHVFGPEAAIAFIRQAEATPNDPAARQAPDLVPSEPESESGTPPLTLAQLYNRLTDPLRKFARGTAAQAAVRPREQAAALDLKPTIAEATPPAPEWPLAWHAEISPDNAILPQ
ncbi:MAG: hypothetical protein ACXWJ2_09330 [Hyphomicrobium sp.]